MKKSFSVLALLTLMSAASFAGVYRNAVRPGVHYGRAAVRQVSKGAKAAVKEAAHIVRAVLD